MLFGLHKDDQPYLMKKAVSVAVSADQSDRLHDQDCHFRCHSIADRSMLHSPILHCPSQEVHFEICKCYRSIESRIHHYENERSRLYPVTPVRPICLIQNGRVAVQRAWSTGRKVSVPCILVTFSHLDKMPLNLLWFIHLPWDGRDVIRQSSNIFIDLALVTSSKKPWQIIILTQPVYAREI